MRPILAAFAALAFILVLQCAAPAGAQTAPPVQGVTGTVATDATIKAEHEAAHKIAEGAARAVSAAKKILPGGKGTNQDPLDALSEGRRVVVAEAALASSVEGVVIDVNKRRRQLTIRFADKKTQTLRVLDRTGAEQGGHVVVSLADQPGDKITYDFTRVP